MKVPTVKLNDGNEMPVLGLGTAVGFNDQMEWKYDELPVLKAAIEDAIKLGYRHMDSAHIYQSEKPVGDAVAECIKQGIVTRDQLFITTKLWNHQHSPEKVLPALRESLKKLSMDYVDLYLIHWPHAFNESGDIELIDYVDTWHAMEKAKELGLAKSIGVSNFNIEQLTRVLKSCNIKPAVNQFEVNLNLQQQELIMFCKENDIVVTAYTPFGSMIGPRSRINKEANRIDDPKILEIADKYGKKPTQIILKYLLQLGVTTIPKTVTKSRMIENADIFDFELSTVDMNTLKQFDNGYRTIREIWWQHHPNFPFNRTDKKLAEIPRALLY